MKAVWFLAGGAAGVWATSKARRVREALTSDGLHDRVTGWWAGARVVRDELRAGVAEKEAELRERLALADGATVLALPTNSGDAPPDLRPPSPRHGSTHESRDDH